MPWFGLFESHVLHHETDRTPYTKTTRVVGWWRLLKGNYEVGN